ncbi:hypothetical protein [Aquiflexum sp.]|uniref:hypothetical protein n=1 Tax=Aquiflexum sp. TaxID=1872584 RepID=UPI00359430E0
MQHITGTDRLQITFSSLDEQICKDNSVRIIDAFVDSIHSSFDFFHESQIDIYFHFYIVAKEQKSSVSIPLSN